jgi:hypothetical protein
MSFWANVVWANVLLGKRRLGKCLWANVVWANVMEPGEFAAYYRVDDMFLDDFTMQLYQQSNTAELPFLRHMKALDFLYKISILTLAEFCEKT